MCWECVKRSKHFLLGDHFVNSHKLISWQYMSIVMRKLMLVTVWSLRVKVSQRRRRECQNCNRLRLEKQLWHGEQHEHDYDVKLPYATRAISAEGLKGFNICFKIISVYRYGLWTRVFLQNQLTRLSNAVSIWLRGDLSLVLLVIDNFSNFARQLDITAGFIEPEYAFFFLLFYPEWNQTKQIALQYIRMSVYLTRKC